jgi:aldose 1-epimerase
MMPSSIQKSSYGKLPSGEAVDLYTLTNKNGLVAKVCTYGALLTEMHVPDRSGKLGDVVLGFDDFTGWTTRNKSYFGVTVGRVANRIANARFSLEGKSYDLAKNDGPHCLHGGLLGFGRVNWKAEPIGSSVKLIYVSRDGEDNFPGTLTAVVTYTLTDANELKIEYAATTDKTTLVNLTNHTYFNLACKGGILDHEMQIFADRYTPVDATLIPTGELAPVAGTPLDFTRAEKIGARIRQIKATPVGYDHNYVLNGGGKSLTLAARVRDPLSGRTMELSTTEPGVQFYSGNFLDGSTVGKGGVAYQQWDGFCLETQKFPDAINQPRFPSIVLKPGETYSQITSHKFSV